jgi:PBP superfamily domain
MSFSKKVTYLVAGAIATALGSAAVLANGPAAAPTNVFYFAGGSAEPQAVAVATCNLMNNVDSYSSAAVGQVGANYLNLYGTLKKAISGVGAAGTPVAIIYKFNGGSLPNGGVPQAPPFPTLPYPTVASAFVVPAGGGPGNYCTPGNGTTTVSEAAYTLTNNQQPSFGLTDLEASAFTGINNPVAPAALPVVGGHVGIYDLVFGLAVSPQVWAQKQNFTYPEVAGILAGAITNWNQLYGDQPGFVNTPLPTGNIILLDRNVGSGHKASSSAEFLGYPQLGAVEFTPNSNSGTGYIGGAGGGAPPVACSTAYQDIQEGSAGATVSDLKLLNQTTAKGGCGGMRAVAILSMDNPPAIAANQNVSGTNDYFFVALDGTFVDAHTGADDENGAVGTSYDNVIKGNYHWFYQANFNTGAPTTTASAAMNAAYLAQLKSFTLPGCGVSPSPGLQFPGNVPGIVNDLDNNTAATLGQCVTVSTRGGNSDSPPFPYSSLPGNITLGIDPL